jgi:alkylation response protein AidB-like acyl-CoA dehydrogenase
MAAALAERGLRGLPFPAKYGGGDAGYTGFVLALEQICQASVTVGAIMSVNTVPQEGIYRFGTEEQKERLLRPLAEGKKLAGIGFTEPDTGSDPRMMRRWQPGRRRLGHQRAENVHVVASKLAFLLFARQSDGTGKCLYRRCKAAGLSIL